MRLEEVFDSDATCSSKSRNWRPLVQFRGQMEVRVEGSRIVFPALEKTIAVRIVFPAHADRPGLHVCPHVVPTE
jgi:hypothetical protein